MDNRSAGSAFFIFIEGKSMILKREDMNTSDLKDLSILCTGGSGTLGRAIATRRKLAGWKGKFTVYSTDAHKHDKMRRDFPDINFIQGDIRDDVTLYNAMVGHDVVIHAAACKVIPVSEFQSIDTYKVNVEGSLSVCKTAVRAGVKDIVGISTDKACHSVNAYGATKYLMEKIFQEYSRIGFGTEFHLVRYGNVLESNGSVIEAWKNAIERGETIRITDPAMTRFWISPAQAVDYVLRALGMPTGTIYIPKMGALSIGKLAQYTLGDAIAFDCIPLRPGEKMHECLLTEEEGWYAIHNEHAFLLFPTTARRKEHPKLPYTSDMARELSREELMRLLANV